MPKLKEEVIQQKRESIEEAARELFIGQGFHATSMRDISKRAKVSLGNLYNYFPTKEAIFESLINRYVSIIDDRLSTILDGLDEPLDPNNLRTLGLMTGDLVNEHSDFWLLMYIDVLEFRNRHFRKMFERLSVRFGKLFKEKFDKARKRGDLREGIDPATVFTVAYMQFFNYFLVEKLFGGKRHLGLNDKDSIDFLTKIFAYGTLSDKKLSDYETNSKR
ncbi:MAG: TetR/AcrR family transcriptional regulator [Pyrinomonadaceae bacterium]